MSRIDTILNKVVSGKFIWVIACAFVFVYSVMRQVALTDGQMNVVVAVVFYYFGKDNQVDNNGLLNGGIK
jgi:branched-subunit amino acid ABC-type transport system permease component